MNKRRKEHFSFFFNFFEALVPWVRERVIRNLPLDHDIMSALTITEIFPREHTLSKLGIDSVAKSCRKFIV